MDFYRMIRRTLVLKTFLLLGMAFLSAMLSAQDPAVLKQFFNHINYLASEDLEGRETGSQGEQKAAAYIASSFWKRGLTPLGSETWYQPFTFTPKPSIQKHRNGDSTAIAMSVVKQITGKNVVAAIDRGSERWLVIGAHYDHLGRGAENSLAAGDTAIHRGADDNASGVSALIELADRFSRNPVDANLLFIAFSGEEKGLFGSKHFVNEPTISIEKVVAMLNMDMIGRLNDERALAIHGTGTSPIWENLLHGCNRDSLKLVFHESGVGPSDHTSFYLADIPVLHFFTGQHDDYHKPSDSADKINLEGLFQVTNFIERTVRDLDQIETIAFAKTKDQQKTDQPRFKVTLGVVPDYMQEGKGLRLDGVSDGRPAQKAGIAKGDVIVRIGDQDVIDIYGYMEALGKYDAGDATQVVVKREGQTLTFDVVFD